MRKPGGQDAVSVGPQAQSPRKAMPPKTDGRPIYSAQRPQPPVPFVIRVTGHMLKASNIGRRCLCSPRAASTGLPESEKGAEENVLVTLQKACAHMQEA